MAWYEKPTNPHLPVAIFVTVALAQMTGILVLRPQSWLAAAWMLVTGMLCWSLLEYVFHRGLLHARVTSGALAYISRVMHLQHHDEPHDPKLVAASPVMTVPLYVLFTVAVRYLTGSWELALAWGSGLALGYTAYERVHYVVHFRAFKGPVMTYLKKHHYLHHFSDSRRKFGVSSPVWDVVFGTY